MIIYNNLLIKSVQVKVIRSSVWCDNVTVTNCSSNVTKFNRTSPYILNGYFLLTKEIRDAAVRIVH